MVGQYLGDGYQVCLCGLLSAQCESLPERIRAALRTYFDACERWLSVVLLQGMHDRTLVVPGTPDDVARMLYVAYQESSVAGRLFESWSQLTEVESSARALTGCVSS